MSGDNNDRPPTHDEPPVDELFGLLGNKTRANILRVFGERYIRQNQAPIYSFSELRSSIDDEVDPSQLHYHLQQLVGQYLEETDGGYRLRSKGATVFVALRSGLLGKHEGYSTVDDQYEGDKSVGIGFDCHYCQSSVEVTIGDGAVLVHCSDCEYVYDTMEPMGGVFACEDNTEAVSHFVQWTHHVHLGWARGICPICGNRLGSELVTAAEASTSSQSGRDKAYVYRPCNHCGIETYLSLGEALIVDPVLVSFCYDHGVDLLSTPFWELAFAGTDKFVTVRSTDPWEVALQVSLDQDTLELVVDGDLNIVERNRRSTTDGGAKSTNNDGDSGDHGHRGDIVNETLLPDKTNCLQSLRRHRWPEAVTCPHCDNADTTKDGTTSRGAQYYRCHGCESTFNDLTGTIFAGRGFTIPEMFYVIQAMDEMDTARIARQIDRSYDAVLDFVHEIREAPEEEIEFARRA